LFSFSVAEKSFAGERLITRQMGHARLQCALFCNTNQWTDRTWTCDVARPIATGLRDLREYVMTLSSRLFVCLRTTEHVSHLVFYVTVAKASPTFSALFHYS